MECLYIHVFEWFGRLNLKNKNYDEKDFIFTWP